MFHRFFLFTSVIVASTSHSLAADPVEPDQSVVPIDSGRFDWSGLYVGAHIGYSKGHASTLGLPGGNGGPFDQGVGIGYATTTDPNGLFGGLQIGHNWQNGDYVFGIEADIGYLGADDEQLGYPNAPSSLDDTGMIVDYGWYGVLAARLGYAMDRTLFYGKGGLVIADVDVIAGDLDNAPFTVDDFDISDTTNTSGAETGFTIGAGIEYAIDSSWSLKAEYLYMDFGSYNSADPQGNLYETDLNLHTIKVGMNYKF